MGIAGNVTIGGTSKTANIKGRLQLNNENNQEYSSFDIVSASLPDQSILATFRRSDATVGLSLTGDLTNFNLNVFGNNTNIGSVIRTKGTGSFSLETNGASRIAVIGNTGNVGIGVTNPSTKLHINDNNTNTTVLNVENSFTLGVMTCSPAPTETGIYGIYSYMVLTYTTETGGGSSGLTMYTVTSPAGGLTCDVLMVGGAGAGGRDIGGSGGGGTVLYASNVVIPAGNHEV